MSEYWSVFKTPVGKVTVEASDRAITHIRFESEAEIPPGRPRKNHLIRQAEQQLTEYFRGERCGFSLPLELSGTDFQKRVWKALASVPFGVTTTYGVIARKLRKPQASRAVGAACARNPIPIVIPCHRVIGSTGRMTGFGGGIETKEWLLKHEGVDIA